MEVTSGQSERETWVAGSHFLTPDKNRSHPRGEAGATPVGAAAAVRPASGLGRRGAEASVGLGRWFVSRPVRGVGSFAEASYQPDLRLACGDLFWLPLLVLSYWQRTTATTGKKYSRS